MDHRQQALTQWLQTVLPQLEFKLTVASADASFRRYFRVHLADSTLIAMDAPPSQENCEPFIRIAKLFGDAGMHVPKVMAQDLTQGFLLLTDLGDVTYLSQLNENSAPALYHDANMALVKLQLASKPGVLPNYDDALLTREMQLFPDWYIAKHLNITLDEKQLEVLQKTFALLNKNILAQGQVYVHRDYHSRNLMVCEDNPGVLDFQDAVYGAITYDLVSLLKDAYIGWDEEKVIDWLVRYWQQARKQGLPVPEDFSEFYRDFEYMGAQRHIKVLGIFARLYHRDGKDGYLKDMPLVMHYLRRVCERYIELKPMLRLLDALENKQAQVGYTF
ncbi:MAG: aminoglycoside phosphotransferase [Methylotenera sp. 24-45-7]|nr:MAG: aminoglycoside phosphotransferase [Mehylophilales bacterium 35-46-6]OYZ41287.1 MAG: aminoglycoside phosphotransferase [Methylotenera sp. 24-45-7]OZA09920.1 MAG: aminoglycoside phosphotransferase [Methylotenera sp. 17-45-7]OZA52240.1 MAG: aminoglycoside phosphotransferase [Methylophilales bacterium 39-45-7]HQS37012.1 phosphotransferase [Methylotenera sp.]